jgi:hypothetical protein
LVHFPSFRNKITLNVERVMGLEPTNGSLGSYCNR